MGAEDQEVAAARQAHDGEGANAGAMRLLFAIPPNEYRQHVGGAHGLKNAPRLLPMTQQIEHCVASSVIVMDRDCGRWIGAAGPERWLRARPPFYAPVGESGDSHPAA